ncbi:MAG: insulinase family protein [Bacteroidetes bacterium]|nr:insulinase family protein [Bacteroidota bacterium]
MSKITSRFLLAILSLSLITSCNDVSKKADFKIDYSQFTLENGLSVILHIDRSDPVVAVNMTCHVGSSRELPGRTGFAHLFEHLLFNESENLGRGGLDNMSARIGGSGANGSTSRDRTNYFQTIPKDALEKMIWAEADKLGWFINTVTDPVLAKEKQVVKNEKRQNYDNRPYGHTSHIICDNLYPAGHPYSWTVIGSLEDVHNATLQDVKDFYNTWYVPNNVTLVIAGDFDPDQAKEWVEKYFGEIEKGQDMQARKEQIPVLKETKKLYYEDLFARLPAVTFTWPSVPEYHPDAYALDILTTYLSDGKKAPLHAILVEELQLCSGVGMYNGSNELAGEISLSLRAYPNTDLNEVNIAILKAFARFEKSGIPAKDLKRIKAGLETGFYSGLSSVMGKSYQLAHAAIFANDPGQVAKEVDLMLEVSASDITEVYNKYIKDQPNVLVCVVPKGQSELVISGSQLVTIDEENISEDDGEGFDVNLLVDFERTPSRFDRTIEPPYGEGLETPVPEIWKEEMSNGMKLFGIENFEVPLVQFEFRLKGGLLLDETNKVGVANMMARLMNKGTESKTPVELEDAIDEIGARINISAGKESISISGSSLSKNYEKTMALVIEMLTEPRWDEKELDLIRQSINSNLQQQKGSPASIARNEFSKLIYGEDQILSNNQMGSEESVANINMNDLKAYYEANLAPNICNFHFVGAMKKNEVVASLEELNQMWENREVVIPATEIPSPPENSVVYFYDIPNAKQSVIYLGYPCMSVTDPDFYPATIMNYILGGGGFASRLTQELRQNKGYTYGVGSGFSGSDLVGPFAISTNVKTSISFEAISLIQNILKEYPVGFNTEDLAITKAYLIKKNARAFETQGAKLSMLRNISAYGWNPDYVKSQEAMVRESTVDGIQDLASKYADPGKMIYLIVGDAASQLDRMKSLGYGDPILLNK